MRRRRTPNLWDREPARLLGLLSAALALTAAFGLKLTGEQVGAIMAFAGLVFAEFCRSQVSPTKTVDPLIKKDDLLP